MAGATGLNNWESEPRDDSLPGNVHLANLPGIEYKNLGTTEQEMLGRWNLLPLGGFIIVVAAFLSYFLFFANFPVTRDVPWLNLLLMAAGLVVAGAGVRRAFAQAGAWFGKISASLLAVLSVLILGLFVLYNFSFSAQLPASGGAPKVGETAPDFALPDQDGREVKLSDLVAALGNEPAEASGPGQHRYVLLVFYRGYW